LSSIYDHTIVVSSTVGIWSHHCGKFNCRNLIEDAILNRSLDTRYVCWLLFYIFVDKDHIYLDYCNTSLLIKYRLLMCYTKAMLMSLIYICIRRLDSTSLLPKQSCCLPIYNGERCHIHRLEIHIRMNIVDVHSSNEELTNTTL